MIQSPKSTAREVLQYAANSFADDPDAETALLAREVHRLLDSDAKLERARELVAAYNAKRDETRACRTLFEIDACTQTQPQTIAAEELQQSSMNELVEATHYVAELALKIATTLPQRELRSECRRVALRSETDASRLQNRLLWLGAEL
jgi:hypothetical protein